MIVAFSVSPAAGPDGSVAEKIAAAVAVVKESGLPWRLDPMFTTIEGEWAEVMDVVRRACEAAGGGERVGLVLKADIRPGFEGMNRKVAAVEAIVGARSGG